ncbi:neuropeptide FF receptor 1-like [Anolis sagrei]|uniref:neuropeptide FF receptor 1-like n=1 Tax=Anolis sagrei TaxID=38937 RepID=UPI003521F7ED
MEAHEDINQTTYTLGSSKRNLTYSPYYQHSLPIAASYTVAYLLIFVFCMLGNGLVCFIILRNRRMRTVTNLFILNLAISDLLVGIFCVPTTLVDNLITGWPFSNSICKLSGLAQGMSVSSSIFTLVAIAVDRFRCIVHPFKPKLTFLQALNVIGIIWILAITIMCPSAVMLTVAQQEGSYLVCGDNQSLVYPLYFCYEAWPESEMHTVYTTVLFLHIYVAPLSFIMFMYGRIGFKLYMSSGPVSQHHVVSEAQHKTVVSKRKLKVIKMLVLVTLLFMLSWLPLWTLMLFSDYTNLDEEDINLLASYGFPFAHWLAFSNSSVNPIIYGYFNENFKKGFQAAFKLQTCSREMVPQEVYAEKTTVTTNGFGARNKILTSGESSDSICLKNLHPKAPCDPSIGDV